MTVSIVIVTHGRWDVTERCLQSLREALGDRIGDDWEVVVVDNASPDETPHRLREWADQLRLELLTENLNFAGGCNRGAAIATGDVLIFLNNDTTVPPGALEALAAQTREPGIAAAGCRLLFPDGTIQHAGVAFYSNPRLGGQPMPQHVFHHQAGEVTATRAIFETDSVTAACLAVTREAFFDVGGYDTRYANGLEDIDLCLKLRVAGHRIVYRGDIEIIHHEGASRGKGEALFATPEKLAAMAANDSLFVSRWSGHLDQDDELASTVWDGELRDGVFERHPSTHADIIVLGQPTGIGAGADEARAFLTALVTSGHQPAAVDLPSPNVAARLSGRVSQIVEQAMRARGRHDARFLLVPMGPSDIFFHPNARPVPGGDSIVRLGAPDCALDLSEEPTVIAASSAVRNALLHRGMRSERVLVMPSPLVEYPRGNGGAGVLVVLPTHDRSLSQTLLEALGPLAETVPIRLLPTAFDRGLAEALRERLPHAEVLGPCSDEERFRRWAGESDAVLAADPDDLFGRQCIVAAGVGTPVLSLDADGPAADLLGSAAITSLPTVARDAHSLLERSESRDDLMQRMLAACSPTMLSALLHPDGVPPMPNGEV